jgi:hypothetical protein
MVIHINDARFGATPDDWAHFDMILGLTADLLPVVSNPKAVISPDSKMGGIGKTPSIYNAQRKVAGIPAWTQQHSTPEQIQRWAAERDYGICIQTRRIRALDVDIDDAELAGRVRAFIDARFSLPARIRDNASKFLLAFDCPGEIPKRRIKTAQGMIEMLGTGQQFVALGRHTSGVRYEWEAGLPDAFPVLALEQLDALWLDLQAEFGIEAATSSTASSKHQKLAEAVSNDPVANLLSEKGMIKRTERDGRLHIVCPFEAEHTSDSGDSSTTYWPAHTGGYVNGHFHCLHAHCEDREDAEFLNAIGYVDAALMAEFEAIADEVKPIEDVNPTHTPDEAPRFKFKVESAHDFSRRPAPSWIIKNVIPQGEVAMLFGESGSGKTFVALDFAIAISTGEPWRGMLTKKGRVVYVAAEGAGGFRNRLVAYAQHHQIPLDSIPIGIVAGAPNLLEKADALDLAKSIVHSGGADVIFIDTLAQTTPGANENSSEGMGKALEHCKGLHRATKALVILMHHSGKDSTKGARGWSGIRAAVDAELEVVRDNDDRAINITKQKDGEDGQQFGFRLNPIVIGFDEDAEEITSCVMEHTDVAVRKKGGGKGPGTNQKEILDAFDDLVGLGDEGVAVNDLIDKALTQIPFDDAAGKKDRRRETLLRALDSLIKSAKLYMDGGRVVSHNPQMPTNG